MYNDSSGGADKYFTALIEFTFYRSTLKVKNIFPNSTFDKRIVAHYKNMAVNKKLPEQLG